MKVQSWSMDLLVIDDFLTPGHRAAGWNFFQDEPLEAVHSRRWIKASRYSEGNPLRGETYRSAPTTSDRTCRVCPFPTGRGTGSFIERIRTEPEVLNFIGKERAAWPYFFAGVENGGFRPLNLGVERLTMNSDR